MPNVTSIFNKHNKTSLDPHANTSKTTCNFINKEKCPLLGKCITNNIKYKGILMSNEDTYQDKIFIVSAKLKSHNNMQTTENISSMTCIKMTQTFE